MKFLDYIKGNRKGTQAQRTELEAMRDPLLGDAIDGFDAVGGDHGDALKRMSGRIAARTSSDATVPGKPGPESKQRRIRRWSAAAAAVILVCVLGGTGVWMMRELRKDRLPVLSHQIERDHVVYQEILPPLGTTDEEQDKKQEESPEKESLEDIARPAAAQQREDAAKEERKSGISDFVRVVPNESSVDTRIDFDDYTEDFAVAEPAEEQIEEIPDIRFQTTVHKDMAAGKLRSGAARSNISGFVVDVSSGRPMPGAVIRVNGTNNSAVADSRGHFYLSDVPGSAKVNASMLGYNSNSAGAGDSKYMMIAMTSSRVSPGEAEAVGYSAGKKSAVASSASEAVANDTTSFEFGRYLGEAAGKITEEGKLTGSAVIEFEVDGQGRPCKINVVESTSAKAGREARRLLRNGPDWEADSTVRRITVTF